jgi:hypothetical protein
LNNVSAFRDRDFKSKFNAAIEIVRDMGRLAYGKEWQEIEAAVLPDAFELPAGEGKPQG